MPRDPASRGGHQLSNSVEEAVRGYLETMDDQPVSDLLDLVLAEVEAPLIACVLQHTDNNQSRTADILGISRGTLRKKLRKYRLL